MWVQFPLAIPFLNINKKEIDKMNDELKTLEEAIDAIFLMINQLQNFILL